MSTATTSARGARLPRVTDEDIAACRTAQGLTRALGILGRVGDGGVICPNCGKVAEVNKKFKIFDDGGYKHFGPEGCHGGKGTAIDLLQAEPLKLSFPDAVRILVGKPTSVPVPMPSELPTLTVHSFKATVDPEVYAGVLAYGRKAFGGEGVRAAQEFYGQWHIEAPVVADSGAVYITRPDHFADAILKRFGVDRLLACGLFVMNKNDEPMSLIGKKWPVVEPARDADGRVVNLQFRASNAQYAKYLLHRQGKLPYEGNQKFVQLKGVQPGAVNLDQIAQLPAGTQISVVEGFKDRLAAATMGVHAVGFPGTGYRPSAAELEVLTRYRVVLSFDGDNAGIAAMHGYRLDEHGQFVVDDDNTPLVVNQGMLAYLREHDVEAYVHPLSGGQDITDRLVEKHARSGCRCPECAKMRARLGI